MYLLKKGTKRIFFSFFFKQFKQYSSKTRKISTKSCAAAEIEREFNKEADRPYHFLKKSVGLFQIPELKESHGFALLEKETEREAAKLISECLSKDRSRKVVEVFDDTSNVLCKTADLAEFVYMAHPDGAYAKFAEQARNAIGGLVEKLNTHRTLYDCLKNAVENGDVVTQTEIDRHVGKLFLFDFEQCGIHLNSKQRNKVTDLNDQILFIGSHFQKAILENKIIPMSELPRSISKLLGMNSEKINMNTFWDSHHDEDVREFGYRQYLSPNKQQEERLKSLLNARHELAVTCGFDSYAQRAVKGSLAETPALVHEFLDQINAEVKPFVDDEMNEMLSLKKSVSGSHKPVALWDLSFLCGSKKERKLGSVSESDIIPYFSLGSVIGGLSTLFKQLYGISLVLEETLPGEIWHKDVKKLAVVDESEGILGHIYCDLYSRPGKSLQDCQFTIRCGKQLPDGSYQNPISVLHMNLSPPTARNPTLLTFAMLENVFHEMGHGIHSMLGRTQYQHVSGTRCPTDFAEVPSVLMEFFARDARVLQMISKHVKTGEQIPLELLQPFLRSKNVFPALDLQRQIFYSAFDQRFHGTERLPSYIDTTEILAEIQSKYYHLPHVHNTAYHHKFGHVVGYGAKYYSYMMSRAVASWIWQKYFQENPFNRQSGERFRNEVLAHGGGKPPKKMVSDFLAKEITAENLTQAVISVLY